MLLKTIAAAMILCVPQSSLAAADERAAEKFEMIARSYRSADEAEVRARIYGDTADKLRARGWGGDAESMQIRSNEKLAGKNRAQVALFRAVAAHLSGEIDDLAAGILPNGCIVPGSGIIGPQPEGCLFDDGFDLPAAQADSEDTVAE